MIKENSITDTPIPVSQAVNQTTGAIRSALANLPANTEVVIQVERPDGNVVKCDILDVESVRHRGRSWLILRAIETDKPTMPKV